MKVAIIGTGAMASLFAARFAPFTEVALLGRWKEALTAINERGIILESEGGWSRVNVQAADDPSQAKESDLLIILVKSCRTETAIRRFKACLSNKGTALTLQNGLGNLEILQSGFGADRSLAGATTMGATLLAPGHVRVFGKYNLWLSRHPKTDSLRKIFEAAGFNVPLVAQTETLLWSKLAINAAINPLSVLFNCPNAKLADQESSRDLMTQAANEVQKVAEAKGISLLYPDAGRQAFLVAKETGANRSSMLQDISHGRPTEIDAINGAVVRSAEEAGVPAPINRMLWQRISAMSGPKEVLKEAACV